MGIMRRNRRIPDITAHPVTPELFRTSVYKKMRVTNFQRKAHEQFVKYGVRSQPQRYKPEQFVQVSHW